jgi:hypothetical protein
VQFRVDFDARHFGKFTLTERSRKGKSCRAEGEPLCRDIKFIDFSQERIQNQDC